MRTRGQYCPIAKDAEVLGDRRSLRDAAGFGGVYVNFLGDEGESRIRAAYGEAKFARLAQIKGRYDPNHLFRLNQNIPPAAQASP